jgi:predicted Zn-dependent peptidase
LRRNLSRVAVEDANLTASFVGAPDVSSFDLKQYQTEESQALQNCQTTSLKNGLKVISTSSSTRGNSVVSVFVNAGSRYETYANNGVSHFVERFFFSGTNNRSYLRLVTDLQKTGANVSAQTGREEIVYRFEALSDAVPQVLELVADSVLQSRLHPWDLPPKVDAVKGDLEAYVSTPELLLNEALHQTAFQNVTLGRSLFFPPHNFNNITTETVKQYMQDLFVPSRIKIVGTNIDHSSLVTMSEKLFGSISEKQGGNFDSSASEYLGGTQRLHETSGKKCHTALAFKGSAYTNSKDYHALNVLTNVLGYGVAKYVPQTQPKNSRLYKALTQYNLAAVRAFNTGYSDNGLFGVYLSGAAKDVSSVADYVVSVLKDVASGGVSDKELQAAKNQTLIQFGSSLECNSGLNEFFSKHNNVQEQSQAISSVSGQDLSRVASQLLKSQPTFVSYGNLDGLSPRVKV